jgi:hypothetical protein
MFRHLVGNTTPRKGGVSGAGGRPPLSQVQFLPTAEFNRAMALLRRPAERSRKVALIIVE